MGQLDPSRKVKVLAQKAGDDSSIVGRLEEEGFRSEMYWDFVQRTGFRAHDERTTDIPIEVQRLIEKTMDRRPREKRDDARRTDNG